MALVRVYCGLASAYPPRQLAVGSTSLSATIVDDSGRVLDICDIGDDSYGYAYLSTLLGERATGPYSVAIATNSDQLLVPQLLAAAGWALAAVDQDATDEYAERFADDFADTPESAPTQRRALGLARALQAGTLSATLLPCSPQLVELKPVLAAHNALATGRHAAAVALREVLRELYPAALRAFPDPAEPVALAVMLELPEPSQLATSGRGRDATAAVDAATAQLTAAGLADQAAVSEAITALRVAIAETPRRGGVSRSLATTVAETVRQAVAAVRACDAAGAALVSALAERAEVSHPAAPSPTLAAARSHSDNGTRDDDSLGDASAPSDNGFPIQRSASPLPSRTASRSPAPPSAQPAVPTPPPEPAYVADSSYLSEPAQPLPQRQPAASRSAAEYQPLPRYPAAPMSPAAPSRPVSPVPPISSGPPTEPPLSNPRWAKSNGAPASDHSPADSNYPHNRPMSPPPPPPPGITPIREPRSPRQASRVAEQSGEQQLRMPAPRPSLAQPPSGTRSHWPTRSFDDDWAASYQTASSSAGDLPGGSGPATNGSSPQPPNGNDSSWRGPGGVVPPWQSDDLRLPDPPDQPALRLVEPTLPEELRDELGLPTTSRAEPPPLRLVEPTELNGAPRSAPPVSADDDNDLLIFAQTRSAWFDQDPGQPWSSAMDLGWQAAEQAAQPTVGDRTGAGLPRRVPHANLVPGAPPRRDERPLRVVRDPASIAAHTSGYFSGWRRGQEVGGFPLGTRQARRAAGAWEFHRDEDRLSG